MPPQCWCHWWWQIFVHVKDRVVNRYLDSRWPFLLCLKLRRVVHLSRYNMLPGLYGHAVCTMHCRLIYPVQFPSLLITTHTSTTAAVANKSTDQTKAVCDATEWKLSCRLRVEKRTRGGEPALRNSERQFSGNSVQQDRQEHCKTPRWRCRFDGSQPPQWRWKFDGHNNTGFGDVCTVISVFCLLKFRPVAVKQGTETHELSLTSTGEVPSHSDEVLIEKFALNERQCRLRQAFITRFVLTF